MSTIAIVGYGRFGSSFGALLEEAGLRVRAYDPAAPIAVQVEQSFASSDDIVAKFRKLTRGVMQETQQDALVDAVLGLERLPDSLTLIERLRVGNKE